MLLRDISRGKDTQVRAVVQVIAAADADIVFLMQIDHDAEQRTLSALRDALARAGVHYPYLFSAAPNTGRRSGLDLDGDGVQAHPRDAQGYGRYPGHGGMAVLSRVGRIELVQDFTPLLWRDLPMARLPMVAGRPFPSATAHAVQRLSSTGHWHLRVDLGGPSLDLLAYHATPPVFDGPEDRNGLRNADETALWRQWLDGAFGPVPRDFVIMGGMNLDPVDGAGRKGTLRALLGDPRLQDPAPRSAGGVAAAKTQGGANTGHRGDPALDTADWRDAPVPGNLRVDYALPSASLRVLDAGVIWPAPEAPGSPDLAVPDLAAPDLTVVETASRHRLVWVELGPPAGP